MSNVIKGNFGVSKEDIDDLAAIYSKLEIDCEGYVADQQFGAVSRHMLKQDRLIRFFYEQMSEHLYSLQENFYKNGEAERDLKLMVEFRDILQNAEEKLRDLLR